MESCSLCSVSLAPVELAAHEREYHNGIRTPVWACSLCDYTNSDFPQAFVHCLLDGHFMPSKTSAPSSRSMSHDGQRSVYDQKVILNGTNPMESVIDDRSPDEKPFLEPHSRASGRFPLGSSSQCLNCGKCVNSKDAALVEHVRLCCDIKPYYCSVCHQPASKRSHLRAHLSGKCPASTINTVHQPLQNTAVRTALQACFPGQATAFLATLPLPPTPNPITLPQLPPSRPLEAQMQEASNTTASMSISENLTFSSHNESKLPRAVEDSITLPDQSLADTTSSEMDVGETFLAPKLSESLMEHISTAAESAETSAERAEASATLSPTSSEETEGFSLAFTVEEQPAQTTKKIRAKQHRQAETSLPAEQKEAVTESSASIQCRKCGASVESKDLKGRRTALLEHTKGCCSIRPYACSGCGETAAKKGSLRGHLDSICPTATIVLVDKAVYETQMRKGLSACFPHRNGGKNGQSKRLG